LAAGKTETLVESSDQGLPALKDVLVAGFRPLRVDMERPTAAELVVGVHGVMWVTIAQPT